MGAASSMQVGVGQHWWVLHGVVFASSTQVVGIHGVGWGPTSSTLWWSTLAGCPWGGGCVVNAGRGVVDVGGSAWGGVCVIDAGSGGQHGWWASTG